MIVSSTSPAAGSRTTDRLARIIGANGWFSIISGATLLLGAVALGNWFDLPAWVIAVVGLSLIPYGLMLRWAAAARSFDRRMAWLATCGDLAWVLGAVVLLMVPDTMSVAGKWTLTIVTLAVLDFAILQFRELRRSSYSVPAT